jgi:hypothetical protein
MAHYRACSKGNDGYFGNATDIVCRTDEAAIVAAGFLLRAPGIELWEHDRKVASLEGLKFANVKGVAP